MRLFTITAAAWLAVSSCLAAVERFGIQVVDSVTGRGVPLVTLRTTNEQSFVTDSAGWMAIDEPDLLGRKVFFHVGSHGYEFPMDGFGYRGRAIELTPGGTAQLRVERGNIAERLYRVTGSGIYADSVQLGQEVPVRQPLIAGGVSGQDSVQAAVFDGRIHWFWGDTNRLSYPLGQFRTSGAISRLPDDGGLPPSEGIDLTYSVDANGFSRPMFEAEGPGVVWLDGLCVVKDAAGEEHLIGHYSRREGLAKQLGHGVAEFDPKEGKFRTLVELPEDVQLHPQGQGTLVTDEEGVERVYFATPYPSLRVQATLDAVCDPAQYEAFTPRPAGEQGSGSPTVERDAAGEAIYAWKRNTVPLTADQEHKLLRQEGLKAGNARWQTTDAATGERVLLHGGSVRWNAFRNRWVMIAVQTYGKPSFLGEVWYAESERIEGPWNKGVRIVTHDKYSFYNPTQHSFFDEKDGRIIYFEGTYTHTFSGNPVATPQYDYNQVMYRLDLSDPRLEAAR